MNILTKFKSIQLIVLDVDGVLTDGSLLLLDDGQMARKMSIKDGYSLQLAVKKGYKILIISGGSSEAVKLRLQKLGIEDVFMKVIDKKGLLVEYVQKNNFTWNDVLYMGDDIPDIPAMKIVGLPCCPSDAAPEVRAISHYISPKTGGNGCVRDVIEKSIEVKPPLGYRRVHRIKIVPVKNQVFDVFSFTEIN